MTLDEAIEERLKVIKVQEKLYEESYSDESKEIIKSATDNDRQLAEWLMELKEAKRLLKAAVEDFAVYGALKDLSSEQRIKNPDWQRFNRVFDILDHQWQYADEALALIGEGGDTNG